MTSHKTACLLALASLVAAAASTAPAQNALTNPGFETGALTGWLDATGDVITSGWYFGAGPRSGSYAWGAATNWGTQTAAVRQRVAVTGGQSYEARGWFWLFCNSGMCAATSVEIEIVWRDAGGAQLRVDTTGPHNATQLPVSSYTALQRVWEAPAAAALADFRARLAVDGRAGGGGWAVCAADDFEFRAVGAVPTSTPRPGGQPFWMLTYGRQYGRAVTAVTEPLCEPFAFYENGAPAVGLGFTDQAHPGQNFFGVTDTQGKLRIHLTGRPQPVHVMANDPQGVPSNPSANVYWMPPLPNNEMYHFEFLYTRVADYTRVTAYPYRPIYHYDLVNGFNTAASEPAGMLSDANHLSEWSGWHSQTFVVPPEFNRIIATKVFAVINVDRPFRVQASVHENGPYGPRVGPVLVSREKLGHEFKGFMMCWGLDDVPVVPGRTYAVNYTVDGGQNVYVVNDNYPQGHMFISGNPVYNKDLVAVVIGLHKDDGVTPAPTATPTATPAATATPTPRRALLEVR